MNEAMVRLWLVRHGETQWALERRHTSRTDVPLTEDGERGARSLRAELGAHAFAWVLTSPARRARATCELAGFGGVAVVEPALAEWDYGEYEGLTLDEIRRDRPSWDLWFDGPRGGETLAQVARRIDAVLARVLALEGDVALFAHAHSLRVLATRWVDLPPEDGRLLVLEPSSVSVLGYEREHRAILRWNQVQRPAHTP